MRDAMYSWSVVTFSEYGPYLNLCTTLKDSNQEQFFTVDQDQARAE